MAGNVLSGQLVSRTGRYRPLMLGALVLLAIAFVLMGFSLTTASTQTEVTMKMILVGLGLGPSIPLYTLAIQNGVAPQQIGVATASATFFRQIGATIGVALLGTVFATSLRQGLTAAGAAEPGRGSFSAGAMSLAVREAFTGATSQVYRVGLALVALAALLTGLIPEIPLRKTNR